MAAEAEDLAARLRAEFPHALPSAAVLLSDIRGSLYTL